ncbi:MAG: hypothetical protein L0H53_09470 [Candidatus Nitrosocosmicus sp.]|nr:hypothetical protein [Candidatus Nitrosocosmicus sp.]
MGDKKDDDNAVDNKNDAVLGNYKEISLYNCCKNVILVKQKDHLMPICPPK